jgi:hypothetical protein
MLKELENHGLLEIGQWKKSDRYNTVPIMRGLVNIGIDFDLHDDWINMHDVVYAFVVDSRIRYIGETTKGMEERFKSYSYGNTKETDNDNNVKLLITNALIEGKEVKIWAGHPCAIFQLANGESFKVPASKPIEEHLIHLINPDLNRKRLKAKITHDSSCL